MASQAERAFGSTIKRETAPASGTGTLIPEVRDIQFSGMTANRLEHTANDAVDSVEQSSPGLINPGTVSLTINWLPDDAVHLQLINDSKAATIRQYQVQPVDGTDVIEFDAWVSPGFSLPAAGMKEMTVELTIAGSVDFEATAWA